MMTTPITPSQLDELERKARAAPAGPYRLVCNEYGTVEKVACPTDDYMLFAAPCGHENSSLTGSDELLAHIVANPPEVTLALVAITRAALAWSEARREHIEGSSDERMLAYFAARDALLAAILG